MVEQETGEPQVSLAGVKALRRTLETSRHESGLVETDALTFAAPKSVESLDVEYVFHVNHLR